MFGIPIRDWLTYTNAAYLLSLLLTFVLTATLWRVSVAAQNQSDTELEKYKSDARVEIAKANAQASIAQKDAADARLETERLRSLFSGRSLPPIDADRLVVALRGKDINVAVSCMANDPESINYALQLYEALEKAKVAGGRVTPVLGTFFYGVKVMGPSNSLKINALKEALSNAHIEFGVEESDSLQLVIGAKLPVSVN